MLFQSCWQEPGCPDYDAENFTDVQDRDDGRCMYKARVIFYLDEESSIEMQQADITTVLLFVNENFFDALPTTSFCSDSIPNCQSDSMFLLTRDLGSVKSELLSYSIRDQFGDEIINDAIELEAGNYCYDHNLIKIEL